MIVFTPAHVQGVHVRCACALFGCGSSLLHSVTAATLDLMDLPAGVNVLEDFSASAFGGFQPHDTGGKDRIW